MGGGEGPHTSSRGKAGSLSGGAVRSGDHQLEMGLCSSEIEMKSKISILVLDIFLHSRHCTN